MENERPLIVQGDMTLLLEVHSARYEEVRDALARFAELLKSPEHMHTYKITPLSIWNAAASGYTLEQMIADLTKYSKYPISQHVLQEITDYARRYGQVKILRESHDSRLHLRCSHL
jgi:DNA excision repair protein ERCC-3